jgi:CBS domain-containing protein
MPKNGKRTNTKQKSSRHSRTSSRKQSIQDVMTSDPKILEATASVRDAAELMRESDIGDVVVLENNQLCGIVTDRDIVVRVLADGGNPAVVTVGEICSRELTTVPPTASIDDVVRLIRQKAIRRVPVVEEDGEVVGIVSIGDIAVARDRESALADVSAAPPNT